jgi:translation initiation factor IF-2
MAENRGVEIKTYNIIYDLIDDIKGAMTGLLEPTFEKELTGQAEVLQTFKAGKGLTVAGCIVRDGEIKRENSIRVFRNNAQIYEGEIDSLRRVKEDVSSVKKGVECGILIKGYSDLKQGDMLEAYKVKEIAPVL